MKLRYTPTEGYRIVELDDGSVVIMEGGDTFDFEDTLAKQLLVDGTFAVEEEGEWEKELFGDSEESYEGDPEDSGEGPAAEGKQED